MAKKQMKAKGGARKGGRRRAVRRNVPEKASMTVVRPFSLLTTNQSYLLYDIQLSQYARAVNAAKAYQLYRIKNVKVVISPLSDTFAAGGGTSVPYMYFQIDRTRNLDNIRTASEFKQLGCVPRRLDDKIISFQWAPSVLNTTLDNAANNSGVFNQYKISPWLRCRDENTNPPAPGVWNPDTTDHQGLVFLCENSGGADVPFKCEIHVDFEFMKPAHPTIITEGHPEPLELNTLAIEVGGETPPA